MSYALVVNMPAINAQSLDNNAGNPYMGKRCLLLTRCLLLKRCLMLA